MKTKEVGMPGFGAIYYKGKPVSIEKSTSTETIIVAKNRLHRWYLAKRYKHTGIRVVTERWLNVNKIKELKA